MRLFPGIVVFDLRMTSATDPFLPHAPTVSFPGCQVNNMVCRTA